MGLRLVAFDTSTQAMAVALHDGRQTLAANEDGGAVASARLLPCIHELLARAGMHLRDLDGVAYGQGPGAFTGLRTSCSVAQGLAFGLGKPVLALDSLMLVAEDARVQAGASGAVEVAVAMDARIEQVYAARYRFDAAPAAASWHVVEPPGLFDLEVLDARWSNATAAIAAGNAWAAYPQRLRVPAPRHLDAESDRAGALMRLALQRWSAANTVRADQALPLYLRDKVALTTQERDAARAAKAARVGSSA